MSGAVSFRLATVHDLPVVRTLWREGFPDDTIEEIDAFWHAVSGSGRCLLCEQAGTPVSMAFLLPAEACVGDSRVPLWYVYAAATRCDRRGEGLFHRLLDEAAARAAAENVAALFLRPGESSLFGYYARCGFRPTIRAEILTRKADELYDTGVPLALKAVEKGYARVREEALEQLKIPYVAWPDKVADLAVEMARKARGGAVFGDWGAALCEQHDKRLVVRELLCMPELREQVLFHLTRCFPCRAIEANTPAPNGRGDIFGMLRPCGEGASDASLYMGLTLE